MSLEVGSWGRQDVQWQPRSAAVICSSWLLYGQYALDARTLATQNWTWPGSVLWSVWHGDSLHVVLLHYIPRPPVQAQIAVYHAASGKLTALLDCITLPHAGIPLHMYAAGRYVSCKVDSVLVPVSQRSVSLCRGPSLDLVAQLNAPMPARTPATICSMGWAAHGSLIAIAWQAELEVLVTVHSGRLHRTVRIESLIPAKQMRSTGGDLFQTFAACSDQPAAAVA